MTTQAAHEAMARAGIYRLLSVAFLSPEEALLARVKAGLSEMKRSLALLFDGDGKSVTEAVTALEADGVTLETLQAEYRQIFGHTLSRECPPYETEYGSAHLFQQAHRLGDIAGFYRAFGLEVSVGAKERLDHIAVELEFMGFLTFKEAYAVTHHGEEKAALCREAERRFLTEHLGHWAPLFAELVGRKASEGFYRGLASLLAAFITAECRRLEVRPLLCHEEDLRSVADEPEGACFPCGVTDLCAGEPKEGE